MNNWIAEWMSDPSGMSLRVECTPAFLGNNLMSQVWKGWGREIRGQFIKIKCQMTRKTEKIEKGSKWNERKVKNIALLNLCLSAKGQREGVWEKEGKRGSCVSEWEQSQLIGSPLYNTQQRRLQQEINKCCNCLCCHLPPTHTATIQHWQRHRVREVLARIRVALSPSGSGSGSIHLGPLATTTRLWQAFLCSTWLRYFFPLIELAWLPAMQCNYIFNQSNCSIICKLGIVRLRLEGPTWRMLNIN